MKRTFVKNWALFLVVVLFVFQMFMLENVNVEAYTTPGTPSNLKAISAGYNSIQISWSAVPGVNGYEIYRSTSPFGYYSSVNQLTSTTFTNQNLDVNTSYSYKVRGYIIAGTSKIYGNYSSIVTAKPGLVTPTNLKAISTGYNSVNITWNGSLGATGYELYRATSPTGTFVKIKDLTGKTYNDINLSTNITYYYRLRAYQVVGIIKRYTNYTLVMSAKPVPGTPTNLKALQGWASISWDLVPGASGYEIYRSTSSTGTYIKVSDSNKNYYSDINHVTSSTFYYKVRAFTNIFGVRVFGNYSVALTAKVMSQPQLPVDKNVGTWYALTYYNHHVVQNVNYDYQYSAVDFNIKYDKDRGATVFAVQSGTIYRVSDYTVIIKHETPLVLRNGHIMLVWYSLYGHMKQDVKFTLGQRVIRGQKIGEVGNVGTPYYHLHFSLSSNLTRLDSNYSNAISPYWLRGDYSVRTLYGNHHPDDEYKYDPVLYNKLILERPMPTE